MIGYGTASRAIAYYGNITFTATGIFEDMIYPVYYLMYSQVDSEMKYLDSKCDANIFSDNLNENCSLTFRCSRNNVVSSSTCSISIQYALNCNSSY